MRLADRLPLNSNEVSNWVVIAVYNRKVSTATDRRNELETVGAYRVVRVHVKGGMKATVKPGPVMATNRHKNITKE